MPRSASLDGVAVLRHSTCRHSGSTARLAVRENACCFVGSAWTTTFPAIELPVAAGYRLRRMVVAFASACAHRQRLGLVRRPPHERRGHGRRLHDAMVAWLFAQGLSTLWLSTDPRTRAERFYRAAGWRLESSLAGGEVRFELTDSARRVTRA